MVLKTQINNFNFCKGILLNDILQKMEKVIKTKEKILVLNDDQEMPKKAYIYSTVSPLALIELKKSTN